MKCFHFWPLYHSNIKCRVLHIVCLVHLKKNHAHRHEETGPPLIFSTTVLVSLKKKEIKSPSDVEILGCALLCLCQFWQFWSKTVGEKSPQHKDQLKTLPWEEKKLKNNWVGFPSLKCSCLPDPDALSAGLDSKLFQNYASWASRRPCLDHHYQISWHDRDQSAL